MILIDTQKEEFSKLKDIRIFEKIDNEKKYNGNLLVIGLGGLGSRVVCNLKGMLMGEISPEDNIHYLMLDSDIPAMEAMIEASKDGIGLNATEIISIYRPNLENLLSEGIRKNPVHPNLANWMRDDFPTLTIGTDGARGNRQIGRLMFSNAYEDVRLLLFDKLEEVYTKSDNGCLDVILVSSVAGGTGSGILSDVAYNIRAYARAQRWKGLRLGGCLLMPDVLYGNPAVYGNNELTALINANGYAALKEIDYYMRLVDKNEPYTFESTTHRLSMKENIFDTCLLISGKQDEQGYIPENIICSDTAYFIAKLAAFKYVGDDRDGAARELLRDVFFHSEDKGYYRVINESDYKIPIKEIENICEHEVFVEAFKRLHQLPPEEELKRDEKDILHELREFVVEKPGDEIHLGLNGLIRMGQFEKPTYKLIKKNQDGLRSSMSKQLTDLKELMPSVIKSLKTKLLNALDEQLGRYMKKYGPYAVMDVIGAAGIGSGEADRGLIAEIKQLNEHLKQYQPSGEFSRIIESIKDIVAKRFFTFPNAKRETENGYYDACIKETLTLERTMLVDGIDGQDVFGDVIRWLRARAERLEELYAQFGEDLKNAIEDLALNGKRITGYLLKDARQHEFLPSDYMTEERIKEFQEGLIRLLVENEANIDNGRVVQVKQEMERVYKNMLISVGVYAPEKLISVAFADKRPTLQETNMMFVSETNEKRDEIMSRAAKAFVEGAAAKTEKKKLCILKPGFKVNLTNKKYISLPAIMPHFSKAVKELLTAEPYREDENTIAVNTGDVEISVDDMYIGVPLSMLACMDDMQKAYAAVDFETYHGLHTDEVGKDMINYPTIA